MSVAVPTAQELTDLRGDLGDTGSTRAFSDAELVRLWERAGGDHTGAVILALGQLLTEAAKQHAYTIEQSREEAQQVFANLRLRRTDLIEEQRFARAALVAAGGFVAVRPTRGVLVERGEF